MNFPSTVHLDQDMISPIPEGSSVLEFACAGGRTAFDLEAMGFKVTAFDIDSDAISHCKAEAEEKGSSIQFLEADGRNLPFEDNSFDAVIMNAFMTMMDTRSSRMSGFLEGFRVLKEGGYLYLADFIQTWDDEAYKKRYEEHENLTGEIGTFIVTEDGSLEGEELYRAHHYTRSELLWYVETRYVVLAEKETRFMTFHGNEIKGLIILAGKR